MSWDTGNDFVACRRYHFRLVPRLDHRSLFIFSCLPTFFRLHSVLERNLFTAYGDHENGSVNGTGFDGIGLSHDRVLYRAIEISSSYAPVDLSNAIYLKSKQRRIFLFVNALRGLML